MKKNILITVLIATIAILTTVACSEKGDPNSPTCGVTTSATGEIITDIKARGTGGGGSFDGTVNSASDLDALVTTAWGDGRLDLHRGHQPVGNVLEAFLGISHNQMHTMMEDCNMNLAAICTAFKFDPENLVETLTNSFVPFLEEGVTNGVLTNSEVETWKEKIRVQFRNRVNWQG